MLLRFRVANFASLRAEQELSMIASDDHPDLAVRPVPRESERVLPVAGVFGKNASGKSNLVKALRFAIDAVRHSHQRWLPEEGVPRWPFQLDEHSRAEPSTFIFDLVVDEVRYQYGFAVDDEIVREEWLYSYPHAKKRVLFEREEEVSFGDSLAGQRELIASVVRPNSLFLSAAAANNHKQLSVVHSWFARHFQRASARFNHAPPAGVRHLDEQMIKLLRYADLGVSGARMVPPTDAEKQQFMAFRRKLFEEADSVEDDGTWEPPPRLALVHEAETSSGEATLPWQWESTG